MMPPPTPAGSTGAAILDNAHKQSALRNINSYLSSHNFPSPPLSLKPLPSSKLLTDTLHFILSLLLDLHPQSPPSTSIHHLLKSLHCPHSLNGSALKAPGTPHAFPHFLAALNWLVHLARFKDHIVSSPDSCFDALTAHSLNCYSRFMSGDDDAAEDLKLEFLEMIRREKRVLIDTVEGLGKVVAELEAKVEGLRSKPLRLEELEVVRGDVEKDVRRGGDYLGKLRDGMEIMGKAVEDKGRELAEAVAEKERLVRECEGMRRRVQDQEVDVWEADGMRREMEAVEREIGEAECGLREYEDGCRSLDEKIRRQFEALEDLAVKSNEALRRLKSGGDLQYRLNSRGSTVEEVLGIEYKSTIKPTISSLTNEFKKSSMANSEELLVLQMQNVQINDKVEAKKKRIADLQHSIEEMEAVLNSMDKEMRDGQSRCEAEAEYMVKAYEAEAQNLDIQHREAKETLKAAELMLHETEKQSKDEVEKCAYELFAMIDAVSKHKEYMERKIHEMNNDLCQTVDSLPKVCKRNMSPKSSSFGCPPLRQTPNTKGR